MLDGEELEDFSEIVVVDHLYGFLNLQCVSHYPSGIVDLVWLSEEEGMSPLALEGESQDDYTMVTYDYNFANLTINNLIRPYRGILRCQTASSDRQITISVVEGK